jgi:hypothetical protein
LSRRRDEPRHVDAAHAESYTRSLEESRVLV